MLASYALSRTLVPTLVMWFYRHHVYHGHVEDPDKAPRLVRPFVRLQTALRMGFDRMRESYRRLARCRVEHQALRCVSGVLRRFVSAHSFSGAGFLPIGGRGNVPAARARPQRTRIEETAKFIDEVEAAIRREIPPRTSRHPRQYRPAQFEHQSQLQRQRGGGPGRRGHPGFIERRSPSDLLSTFSDCAGAEPGVSGRDILFFASRHRQPDDQLRLARAAGHPDCWPRSGQESRGRRAVGGEDPPCPGAPWTCAFNSHRTGPSSICHRSRQSIGDGADRE
jgi:hypothetical protein